MPYCIKCGSPLDDRGVCRRCGYDPSGTATDGSAGARVTIQVNRLDRLTMFAGGSLVVMIVSLFLPWVYVGAFTSVNAMRLTGWFWVVFLALLALLYLRVAVMGMGVRQEAPWHFPAACCLGGVLLGLGLAVAFVTAGLARAANALVGPGFGAGAGIGLILYVLAGLAFLGSLFAHFSRIQPPAA